MIDKTDSEWYHFLEKCRKISHEPLSFASETEVEKAIAAGITQLPKTKKDKKHRWEKDTHSIQRHRRNAAKAQKWADLIGVKIKTTADPTLQLYTQPDSTQMSKWLVLPAIY